MLRRRFFFHLLFREAGDEQNEAVLIDPFSRQFRGLINCIQIQARAIHTLYLFSTLLHELNNVCEYFTLPARRKTTRKKMLSFAGLCSSVVEA